MKYVAKSRFWVFGLLACGALTASCGGDDKKRPDITPFLGVWHLGQAAVSVNCPVLGAEQGAFSGAVNVAAGQGTDLAITFTDDALSGCSLGFDVQSDTTAVPVTGQSCPISAQGIMATFTVSSGAFTASAPTGTVNLNGTAAITFNNNNLACTGNVTGMLSRASSSDAGADAR